ncbi:MAG: SDR family oxidoreductase [Actinobacteria bacterium]|nr:SDR family oxidoreductase [Actinomycetota bacterium]
MGSLDGKVALVTGSTSGIGKASAHALAAEGARIVVNSSSSVDAGLALVEALLTESHYIQGDISKEDDCTALVAGAVERFGQLDVLVNNAGWTTRVDHADHEAMTNEILFKTIEVNVYGTWWMSKAAMPHLKETAGTIVNVTSIAGLRPLGSSLAYGMAKAALNSLTEDMAKFQKPVRVNAVAPGLVATPWTSDWDDLHAGIAATVPCGRSATPEDCAQAVMTCITNTYMNGTILKVDGGTTLAL